MQLSYNEIEDWQKFEDLVGSYFNKLKKISDHIEIVEIKPSGVGSDGGRDILVEMILNDGFSSFERKWIIQCKYYDKNISTSDISDINIPSLIHSYKASGYLLVCKLDVTSKLSQHFEALNKNCTYGYKYAYWKGRDFLEKINHFTDVIKLYFPIYFEHLESKRSNLKNL